MSSLDDYRADIKDQEAEVTARARAGCVGRSDHDESLRPYPVRGRLQRLHHHV